MTRFALLVLLVLALILSGCLSGCTLSYEMGADGSRRFTGGVDAQGFKEVINR